MDHRGEKRYNNYTAYIKNTFGERVQKISLNTGFLCPNRDGTKGVGGCTYCNISTFSPTYCKPKKSIRQQLDEGISFFSTKYKSQKYLAYFQAYTNTYAEIELVKDYYLQAVSHPDVIGLVIGTRPDCISADLLDFLEELAKQYYISLEFGVESTLDKTLDLVNRCHTYQETVDAYEMSKGRGLHLGAHLILGLPGESRDEIMSHAITVSKLPIDSIKLHHLQVVKGTEMAKQLKENPGMFDLFGIDEYVEFVAEFVGRLREDIIIERFISESPPNKLIAPKWNGLKNFEVTAKIDKKLIEKDIWQGKYYFS
ncbi:MAG TPA: TIGR01212 family radical SAM protein [Bacteroidetes bacterium]|nr:TIGR01212 family radical SAM protein [Bacteroidota bacterium]